LMLLVISVGNMLAVPGFFLPPAAFTRFQPDFRRFAAA
jgi:hypothetical protein